MSWFTFDKKEEIIDEERPRLLFTLIEGKGIKTKRGSNEKEELKIFCTIKCEEIEYKSDLVSSTSPRWNQSFSFDKEKIKAHKSTLQINCFASGLLKNTLMGEIHIPLIQFNQLSFDLASPHWYPLSLSSTKSFCGEISVKFGFVGRNYFRDENNIYDDVIPMDPSDSTDQILEKAKITMKGGNESAARSEKLLEQTIEISSQTLNSLRKQEQQMDKIEDGLDNIHENMRKSERKLKGIESWTGAIINKFTPNNPNTAKKIENDRKKQKRREKDAEKIQKLQQEEWKEKSEFENNFQSKNLMLNSNFNYERGSDLDEIKKIDEDTNRKIKSMANSVSILKTISVEINQHLQRDIERLPAIGESVNKASSKMDNVTSRARSIV